MLAAAAQVLDGGYVAIDLKALMDAVPEVQSQALRQATLAVSGADYAPDLEDMLPAMTKAAGSRTQGGCLFQVLRRQLCVFREAAAIAAPARVSPGWTGRWDNRFRLEVAQTLAPGPQWAVGPLGEQGLRQAVDRFGIRLKRHPMPLPARLALPALWQGEHLVSQPHLHLGEGLAAWPAPRHTVTTCGFTVAVGRPHTIYSSVPS
jgi:hypothetical protein